MLNLQNSFIFCVFPGHFHDFFGWNSKLAPQLCSGIWKQKQTHATRISDEKITLIPTKMAKLSTQAKKPSKTASETKNGNTEKDDSPKGKFVRPLLQLNKGMRFSSDFSSNTMSFWGFIFLQMAELSSLKNQFQRPPRKLQKRLVWQLPLVN